jgi:hypothetical protein
MTEEVVNEIYKTLKIALVNQGLKQRDAVKELADFGFQVSEQGMSFLMQGRYANPKFDAWVMLKFSIDLPAMREKIKDEKKAAKIALRRAAREAAAVAA